MPTELFAGRMMMQMQNDCYHIYSFNYATKVKYFI